MLEIALAGAFGGLVKSLIEGGHKLAVPVFKDGYFYLGFLGNVVIGAIVAYFLSVDNVSGFTAGVTSSFIIEGLTERAKKK